MSDKLKSKFVPPASNPDKIVARRSAIGLGMIGVLGSLLHACSKSSFVGPSLTKRKSGAHEDNSKLDEVASSIIDVECPAISTTKIDASAITPMSNAQIPLVKFYGNAASTSLMTLKLKLPGTTQLVLNAEDGRVLALHVISGADLAADGSYRPIMIDGLYLSGLVKVKIISTTDQGTFVSTHDIEYFRTFKGKPVVDLSQQVLVNSFSDKQSVGQFSDVSGFVKSSTLIYPDLNGGLTRPLFTAQKGAKWTASANLKGEIVDVMGEAIGSLDILEYQTFCTYVLGSDQKYYRTMIKIG